MKVAPTGLISYDECEIKSKVCIAANELANVTSVWVPPGNNQVQVCRPCLNYMLEKGDWEIEGARVRGAKRRVDIGLINNEDKLKVVIEVKNKYDVDKNWAMTFFQRQFMDEMFESVEYLILAVPKIFYVWKMQDKSFNEITTQEFLDNYFKKNNLTIEQISVTDPKEFRNDYKGVVEKHYRFEKIIFDFFNDIITYKDNIPYKLSFLEPILGNLTIKKEWTIS